MSFGQNPYVRKAQTAEAKAADAPDDEARIRALRDAAHQWERAATREGAGKKRDEYEKNAEASRRLADGEISEEEENAFAEAAETVDAAEVGEVAQPVMPADPRLLN